MASHKIRVVLFEREPGLWIGQCLEYDIGAQAASLRELLYNVRRSFAGYAAICAERGMEIFSDLPETPREYHELWQKAAAQVTPLEPISFAAEHPLLVPEMRAA
ncbi:MAG TPA: hypothetical protein VGG06_23970 [Thermoanaerobaculia bacterium]|jgi:hypothetical protein